MKTLIVLFTAFALLASPGLQAAPQVDVAAVKAKLQSEIQKTVHQAFRSDMLAEAYAEAVKTGDIEAINEINQFANSYERVTESDLIARGVHPDSFRYVIDMENYRIRELKMWNKSFYRRAIAQVKASVASGAMTTAKWSAAAVALGVTLGVLTKSDTEVPTQVSTTTTATN
ncbi:hypothetical protein [Pseudidiomarina sp.]|uniref:hypothetical protein n=1 Tax=Pseudidiomarina sp. TaxID=2081707 RepID=UPI00299EB703|nr:hypothetical protein [Pseudidiomarina sp.]MDX1706512.1 hypothetical protein [Pseudidiomarina sp.]